MSKGNYISLAVKKYLFPLRGSAQFLVCGFVSLLLQYFRKTQKFVLVLVSVEQLVMQESSVSRCKCSANARTIWARVKETMFWVQLGQGLLSQDAGRGHSQDSQTETAKWIFGIFQTSCSEYNGGAGWEKGVQLSRQPDRAEIVGSEQLHCTSLASCITLLVLLLLLLFLFSLCCSIKLSLSQPKGFYVFLVILLPKTPGGRPVSKRQNGAQLLAGPKS